jgi:hypothetical protein
MHLFATLQPTSVPCTLAGHAHHGNPNDYVTYAGLTLKKASFGEYVVSKVIGGTMWWVADLAPLLGAGADPGVLLAAAGHDDGNPAFYHMWMASRAVSILLCSTIPCLGLVERSTAQQHKLPPTHETSQHGLLSMPLAGSGCST